MKNLFSALLLLLSMAAFSCQKGNPTNDLTKVKEAESATQSSVALGVIPSDHPIHDFSQNPDKHNLSEFDAYYRNDLVAKQKNESYYNNIRKTALLSLVNSYGLLEKGKRADIDFYANEMTQIDLPDPATCIAILKKMQGFWTKDKLREVAGKRYEDNMNFIKTKMKNPDKVLSSNAGKQQELLHAYVESI